VIPYEIHAEAEAEITEAALFYDVQSEERRARFLESVRLAIALIREYPDLGSPVSSIVRKALVPRFPYAIIYEFDGQSIFVLAVAHAHRRPNYWHGRE
jgi:toxin ParE2